MTVTDVKNARTVHYALKNKAFQWVCQALNDACSTLPLPVRVLHSDNGSGFINNALAAWRAVYTHYDNLLNYHCLCQKLVKKERAGGKVIKTYDKPMSPYDRIITDPDAPEA